MRFSRLFCQNLIEIALMGEKSHVAKCNKAKDFVKIYH